MSLIEFGPEFISLFFSKAQKKKKIAQTNK